MNGNTSSSKQLDDFEITFKIYKQTISLLVSNITPICLRHYHSTNGTALYGAYAKSLVIRVKLSLN